MTSFGGVFKNFTWILLASLKAATIVCLFFLPLLFKNYNIVVVYITKLYIVLLRLLMKNQNSNEKKKLKSQKTQDNPKILHFFY